MSPRFAPQFSSGNARHRQTKRVGPAPRKLLQVERLEDRLAPATLTESGTILTVTLNNTDEFLGISSAGTSYTLSSTNPIVDGGITTGRATIGGTNGTVTADGLAAYDTIRIVDGAGIQGTRVNFNNSGVNAYSDDYIVTLDQDTDVGSGEQSVVFNGTSEFGAFNLNVTTTRNIGVSSSANVAATSGTITLRANRAATATGTFVGISAGTGSQIKGGSSGDATIIDGTGGNVGSTNHGVFLSGNATTITSFGGTVRVTGQGGGSVSGNSNHGVYVLSGAQIRAGVSGMTIVEGTGGASGGGGVVSSFNIGVIVEGSGSMISSSGGNVQVIGTGGGLAATTSSGSNYGVLVQFGQITAGGSGSVSADGTGGIGAAPSLVGVIVRGVGSSIMSSGGAVQVTGRGGNGSMAVAAGQHIGVNVTGGGHIKAAGGGAVTVTGEGGNSGGSGNAGILVGGGSTSASITSEGGAVQVTGQGGSGPIGSNSGVGVGAAGLIGAGGSGAVRVEGMGGTGHSFCVGVAVGGTSALLNGTITSGGGTVTVIGQGGGSVNGSNWGVAVSTQGRITAGGNGIVVVQGTGGTGSSENDGVRVTGAGAMISSANGALQVTGGGGSSGGAHRGVYVGAAGRIVSGGVGAVIVQGTGGNQLAGGGGGNTGVRVEDSGSLITSTSGPVLVIGVGGGNGNSGSNEGVRVQLSGQISAGGMGTVTVEGTGRNTGSNNVGVAVAVASITSSGGGVSVTGRGGGSGTGGSNYGVIVGSSGAQITSGAGGAVTVEGTGGSGTGAANHGVLLSGTITSGGGAVQVTGVAANGTNPFGIQVASSGAISTATNGGAITIVCDSLNVDGLVTAGTNVVTVRPRTIFAVIELGGTDAAGVLGLTNVELNRVTAGTLTIGQVNTPMIRVVAPITRSASTNINLRTESDILFGPGSVNTAGGTLTVTTGVASSVRPVSTGIDVSASSMSFANGSNLRIDINGATADIDYSQLNVGGAVNLTGARLVLGGSHSPALGQTFTIVNNDGTDAIIGTFTGLAQGARITNVLGSGFDANISYTGGSGNDVVLTVVAPESDGVADEIENQVPSRSQVAGDGNGDGTADSQQSNVASLQNSSTPSYVTLESPAGTTLADVEAVANPSPADAPEGVTFPIGFLDFSIQGVAAGAATTMTLYLPTGVTANTYYKFGRTPDNTTPHWYQFLYDGTTGAQFNPAANTITLHFVDGGRGDDDLEENGVIVDPGSAGLKFNQPPVAQDDDVLASEDAAGVTIDVLANDDDDDQNINHFMTIALTPPSNGSLINNHDGTFTYQPNGEFEHLAQDETAIETFSYKITDSFGESSTATVTITITGQNDGPSLTLASSSVSIAEGTIGANNGTFSDVDLSDKVTITASKGVVFQSGTNSGSWCWSFDGVDDLTNAVTITARDGDCAVATLVFHLTVNNVAPVATVSNNGPVNYGNTFTVSLSDPKDPSIPDTTADFHYAFSLTGDFTEMTYATQSSTPSQTFSQNAGTYTVYARIIDKDDGFTQYCTTVTVNKVSSATTTLGAGPFVYDGTTHTGGSGDVTGAGGLSTDATSLSYSGDQVNAGTYYVTAHYAGDANHEASDGEAVAITINKASSATTATGGMFTYDATAHAGSGSVNVSGGSVTISYVGINGTTYSSATAPTAAGSYTVIATYAGDDNHAGSIATAVLTIHAKLLEASAWSQGTINIGSNGVIALHLAVSGGQLYGTDTVASLFNGAIFTIKVQKADGSYTYGTLTSAAKVETDGSITVTMQMNESLRAELYDAYMNGRAVNFNMTATANGGNYLIDEDTMSKLLNNGALKYVV